MTQYFYLENAYLCVDCRAVHDSAMQCPACANRCGLQNLANVLDREHSETLAVLAAFNELMKEQPFPRRQV